MASSTISVDLPEPLKAYVDARVDAGSYGTPNEYIRELILDDRDRRRAQLEDRLLEASKGPFFEVTEEEWESDDIMGILKKKLETTA